MTHQNKSLWLPLVILMVLLFCTSSTTSAQTVPEIAEKALAATVYLEMKDSTGKTLGFGSGFFVKPNLIATNYHVNYPSLKTWACCCVKQRELCCILQAFVSCFVLVSRFIEGGNPPLSTKGSSCPKEYVYRSVVVPV